MNATLETPRLDEDLLRATVRLNTILMGGVFGTLGAITLSVATLLSLARGGESQWHYLNLLGVFFPGYSVTPTGVLAGFVWGGIAGALAGTFIYRLYAAGIRQRVNDYLRGDHTVDDLGQSFLLIHAHAFARAVAALAALGLLITTNWLVIRGTADESVHAALLAHYLPGYTVTFAGSVIGALGIFLLSYALCLLLASVHNRIVEVRHAKT